MTLSAGEICSHDNGASYFTFIVEPDGSGCVGGICAGTGLQLNDFVADRDNGTWTIKGIP